MKAIPFTSVVFACGLWTGSRIALAEPPTALVPLASNAIAAIATNAGPPLAVEPLPSTLPELQNLLKSVTNDLAKVKQEQAEQASQIRTYQRVYSGTVAALSTQDVEIAKMQKRMAEIADENRGLAAEVQKRLESLPAYQDMISQQKAIMENTMRLREKERELLRERLRISGEIARLRRPDQSGGKGGTNSPVGLEGVKPVPAPRP